MNPLRAQLRFAALRIRQWACARRIAGHQRAIAACHADIAGLRAAIREEEADIARERTYAGRLDVDLLIAECEAERI